MRIVHINDYFHPQLGHQDTFLALAQVRAGHDVHVITADRYRPFEDYEASVGRLLGPRLLRPGIYVDRGIVIHRLRVRAERRYRVWLSGLERGLRGIGPDVVHVHGVGNPSALRAAMLKRRLGFALILDEHMVPYTHASMSQRLFHIAFRALCSPLVLRRADVLASVTEAGRAFMETAYGFPADRIEVVPLGADTSLFRKDEDVRQAYRARFGYGPNDVVFLYSGKLIPSKGPHVLVEAALRLMDDTPQARVFLLGDGPAEYAEEMMRGVQEAGHAGRFQRHRAVPNHELPPFYSMADVGVWPERSSVTMIEAQACELPIIVSSFPAAAERVAFGNGLVFPTGDVEALADRMREFARDHTLRALMGRNGRRYVAENWDYGVISERFLKLAGAGEEGDL